MKLNISKWSQNKILNVMMGSWVISLVIMFAVALHMRLSDFVSSFSAIALENIIIFGIGEAITEYVGYKWSAKHAKYKKNIHRLMIALVIGYVIIICGLLFLSGTQNAI